MNKHTVFPKVIAILVSCLVIPMATSPALAYSLGQEDEPALPASPAGTCISCHENLYLMHDTGKYFCLYESPMNCVDCHGGDPTATTTELAHYDREDHPVIEHEITICQDCHPMDCEEHITRFDQVAGIGNIVEAPAYQPERMAKVSDPIPSRFSRAPFTAIEVATLILGSLGLAVLSLAWWKKS
jgi:hypothetical protein